MAPKKTIINAIDVLLAGRKTKKKQTPTQPKTNVIHTTSMNFSNYSLLFSRPVPANLIFPSDVRELLPVGRYYALKFNSFGSFTITESDLLNNESIIAFKYELSIEYGICYLLMYIISNDKDPLNLHDKYVTSCPIKHININSPLFVPRRLKSIVSVGHSETKLLNCRCGGIYLNGICINCNYEDFKNSLEFIIDNSKLIINYSDLYVDINYKCLLCNKCKICKYNSELHNKLAKLDFNDQKSKDIAKQELSSAQYNKFISGKLILKKTCKRHTKCTHTISTKDKFNMRSFIESNKQELTKRQQNKIEKINQMEYE